MGSSEAARKFGLVRESFVAHLQKEGVIRSKAEANALRSRRVAMAEVRRCSKCQRIKGTREFYPRKGHGGFCSACKECMRQREREGYRPYRRRASDRRRELRAYGLTEEDYEAMLTSQGGGCAICGAKPSAKKLCVDHDHENGMVRGLLCSPCNRAIGHLGDNADGLQRALDYVLLRSPNAA